MNASSVRTARTGGAPDAARDCPPTAVRAALIARSLIQEMKELRALGEPAGAHDLLARHPECDGNKQLLSDLACEEFSQRRAAGETLDAEEFAARFPTCGRSLSDALVMRQFLDDNPELLTDDEAEDTPWPEPGEMLHGFALIRELGRGSFARVFLAAEPALGDRLVVVKVSMLDGAVEAETLGSLRHPNIVPVHSLHAVPGREPSGTGTEEVGWTVVCMPYHGTATLENLLERLAAPQTLPERADEILRVAAAEEPTQEEPVAILRHGTYLEGVLHLGAQLADAVAYVHDRKICHRDLKPANVLLTPAGQPMLLDFNLSCQEEDAEQDLGGTLPYMAPEQIRAIRDRGTGGRYAVDSRADVFALGVMLYELLAGQHPFVPAQVAGNRKELSAQLLARQRCGPVPLRRLNPRVDRTVARAVESCLTFDPERRLPSARSLADTLRGRLSLAQRLKRRLTGPRSRLCAAVLLLAAGLFGAHQLVTAEPRHAQHLRLGREAYAQERYAQAAAEFSRALALEGDSAAVRFERGRALARLGKLLAAHEDYRRADELAGGKDGKIKAALGYSCTAIPGRELHREAIFYYEEAERAGFKSARLSNNLGWSHAQLGRLENAKILFTQAIEQDPNLQDAYHNRMFLTVRQGAKPFPAVLTFVPLRGLPMPVTRWGPALLERRVHNYHADRERVKAALEEAIPDMKKALELGPVSATLYTNAARLCSLGTPSDPGLGKLGVSYVAKAIEHGAAPEQLRRDFLLQMGLGHLPGFRRLVTGPPSGQPLVPCRTIVDPVHDAL